MQHATSVLHLVSIRIDRKLFTSKLFWWERPFGTLGNSLVGGKFWLFSKAGGIVLTLHMQQVSHLL